MTYELKFDGYRALIINQSSPSGRRLTTWAAIGVTNAGVTCTGDEVRRTRVVLRLFFFLIAIVALPR